MEKILLIKILYGAASIQGFFLFILLWRTQNNQPANRILALLLLLISFHLILVGFDEREFFMTFPHLSRISWVIGTLYGPLVFLFILRTTRMKVQQFWRVLIFLPFLLVVVVLLPYFRQTAAEKRLYLDAFESASLDDFGWVNQFVSVVHIVFAVGNLLLYLLWERKQSDEFSSFDAVRVRWLRQFLFFMLAVTMFGVVIFFARTWDLPLLSGLYRFHFIGVVFLFYWLSYKALNQPVLFGITGPSHGVTSSPVQEVEVKRSEPNQDLIAVFAKVRSVLERDRLYLKSDLTLSELAQRAGLSRNTVSQAINTAFQGNFFDFVNDFRVAEFKRQAMAPDKKHLTQVGIALESGFNSRASFYAVFKKKTGMTPAEYLESKSKVAG